MSPLAMAAIEPPVLRLSAETEPLTLDWNAVQTPADRFVASFLMRGLLKYDSANQPVCDLCKGYTVSVDGKTLRFELKAGENWSDGTRLEAQHFVDSIRRLQSPHQRFKAAEIFREVSAVRALAPNQLEINLLRPNAVFPHLLTSAAIYPIRKDLVKSAQDRGESHASIAVLGPYQLAAWEHGKRIVVEGNPQFKGERPVYRVDFILGTHSQLLAKFKGGKLDILSNPTGEDLMKLPGQRLQVDPYWATRNLVLNVRKGPLSEVVIRRAILHALDRDALPAFLRTGERKVTGLIPPGLPGHRILPLVTVDLSQARKERAQFASIAPSTAIELTLLVRDIDADRRVAEWVTGQLDRIQIKLKPKVVSSSTYISDLEQGRFDLALTVWAFDVASPLEVLRTFETHSFQNWGGWTNVGFDALLGQLAREPNAAQSMPWIDQLSQLVEIKDVAAIPLGYPTHPFMLGARVESFAITPFGDPDLVKIRLKP